MVSRIIATFLSIASLSLLSAHALEVTATVDRNPVMMDEALTLTVTAVGDVDRDAFDSSVLLDNFIVGNTAVSSQTRMVNFDTTKSTTWRTTLFPKQEGRFVIPAIDVAGEITQPIAVRVIPIPDISTNEQRDYFVTAELASESVYVQQHVNYIVRLHMANNIERGSLQAPVLENAVIEQVGEDRQYSDIVNGKRFQIIERTFVIVPEKSGEFVVQAPIFSGEVLARNSRQNFGFFNRTQSVTRRGPLLTLTVNPIPESFQGDWLPSEFVELNEEWSNEEEFIVGEPITRTLTLTVAGQNKEQLPELEQIYPPFVKHYPDQPTVQSAQAKGQIVSQRQESTAIIPSEPGTLVIPGVEVSWFNTRTGRSEITSIPAKSYTVVASTSAPAAPAQTAVSDAAQITQPQTGPATDTERGLPVIWVSLCAALATAWLLTLFAWWNTKKRPKSTPAAVLKKVALPPASTHNLLRAIDSNDVSRVQSLLLNWLNSVSQRSYSTLPEALLQAENQAVKEALNLFMGSRYSQSPSGDGVKELKAALKQREQKQRKSNSALTKLEPLYKS